MTVILQSLAILGAALFTGGALYISLVEHPARMTLDPAAAVKQFQLSYRRAAPWQAATAILSAVCGVLASVAAGPWTWTLGGLMVGMAVPFTLIVVMPANKRLLVDDEANDAERRLLLARWGRLHGLRSACGTLGLLILIRAALDRG